MKLDATDIADLRPLIEAAVVATLERIEGYQGMLPDRIGFHEPEAAAAIGVAPHALRDCRLRGEIKAARIGKRYVYSRESLVRFLEDREVSS